MHLFMHLRTLLLQNRHLLLLPLLLLERRRTGSSPVVPSVAPFTQVPARHPRAVPALARATQWPCGPRCIVLAAVFTGITTVIAAGGHVGICGLRHLRANVSKRTGIEHQEDGSCQRDKNASPEARIFGDECRGLLSSDQASWWYLSTSSSLLTECTEIDA